MGQFTHSLDAKKRLFMPAKHREQLGETFIITRSTDPCLKVYSMDQWNKYTEKLEALPSVDGRDIIRFVYSNAIEVQPDAQGRVLISAELLAYAGITKSAVIAGCGYYAEIWSEEVWNERHNAENVDAIQKKMIDLAL